MTADDDPIEARPGLGVRRIPAEGPEPYVAPSGIRRAICQCSIADRQLYRRTV
jgi:hypothetical protein